MLNTGITWEYASVAPNNITTGIVRLWRQGGVKRIQLSGTIKATLTVDTAIIIATLPENFKPSYEYTKNIIYRSEAGNVTAVGRLTIKTDGTTTLTPYSVPSTGGVIYLDEVFL